MISKYLRIFEKYKMTEMTIYFDVINIKNIPVK